ncbi:MAG: hypothetical protein O3B24_07330 [Verrucomicrobia bacterium]|nr:hypothetical protein [Verrucomicrobiota bacterium]
MNLLRRLGDLLSRHYDRVLAAFTMVLLLIAVVWGMIGLGKLGSGRQAFNAALAGMTPEHPAALVTDVLPYVQGQAALESPPQFSAWSNTVFVPETRCYCIDCRRPIPLEAMICPFCRIAQPDREAPNPEERDFDSDGMPDIWEKKYGFDYRNREDAVLDQDGDGFTNVEEYRGDPATDPTDVASHPSFARKVVISGVKAEPFRLLFKSVITLSDGEKQFAINTADASNPRTYFVKLGAPVGNEGFVVHAYEEKFVEEVQSGIKMRVNVSILTLRSARTLIPLVYGKSRSYVEYHAKLMFVPDNLEFPARVGEPVDLRGESFKVIVVDIPKETVVLESLSDGKRFEVHKPPQQTGDEPAANK